MNTFASLEKNVPAVSIVLPCRNERNNIESCLQSLLKQEAPPGGYEIIVVDGMSNDGTRDILKRMVEETTDLCLIDNPRQITPCAMNAGIRVAKGWYIAIMGAHNRYAPDYLYRSVEVLEKTGADCVGGAMVCEGDSWIQRAIAASHHSSFSVGGARWHNPNYEGEADTVFGGVYRREVFENIGLFDEEFVRNQDDEFNLRLIRSGGKIWHSPQIRSWYHPRESLQALFRQYAQYGYWKVRVIQKHKSPSSIRQLVPSVFVLSLGVLSLVAFWSSIAGWMLKILVATYVLGDVAASFLTVYRYSWKLGFLLPIVFPCYHFGYGMGFLHGVWDFLIFGRQPNFVYKSLTRSVEANDRSRGTDGEGEKF